MNNINNIFILSDEVQVENVCIFFVTKGDDRHILLL